MAEQKIAVIITTKVICKEPGRYIGWPTIAKTREGELLIVFSGDRDEHVCPWGKTQMVRSRDGGKTWTTPVIINNTPLDDRDAGIIETTKGTLLVSWFTSLAFDTPGAGWVTQNIRDEWKRHSEKLNSKIRKQWLGQWIRRSVDAGKTWEEPIRTIVFTPHGPIQLKDGRLLNFGLDNRSTKNEKEVAAAEVSSDDGKTWHVIGTVPFPDHIPEIKYASLFYDEPHVVETNSGKLVAMFRVETREKEHCFLYQAESSDGGRTWTKAHKTPIWGYPPHLIRLKNGWLLVVYGRRIPPFGERACISRDGGGTWDVKNEIVLSNAPNDDLGYPCSVQLDDDSILTVYYQIDKPGEKPCLMGTHWRLR